MPLSRVADTGLNVWTLASVLTAGRLFRACRRIALYVRRDCGTDQFGEPSWERKQMVWKYVGDDESGGVLDDAELRVRTWQLGLLSYLVIRCTEDDQVLTYCRQQGLVLCYVAVFDPGR